MPEDVDEIDGGATFTVGMRVRVRAGTATEVTGTVVEDFGDEVGVPVDVGRRSRRGCRSAVGRRAGRRGPDVRR